MSDDMKNKRPIRNLSAKNTAPAPSGRAGGQVKTGRRSVPTEVPSNKVAVADIEKRLNSNLEKKKDREWNEGIIRTKTKPDRVLISLIVLLLCLGTVMVFSASYPTALNKMGDGLYYLKRHLVYVGLGLAAMIGMSFFPYRWVKKCSWIIYGVGILLLIAVLFIGTSEGVAKRWIYIGPISFQPSEFMKFAMVVMLAWYVEKYRNIVLSKNYPKFRQGTRKEAFVSYMQRIVIPCAILGLPCVLVLLEKHFSGTIILGVIGVVTIVIGGVSFLQTLPLVFAGGAVAGGAFLALNPYALERIFSFAGNNSDAQDGAWQTLQGLYAIGSGGLFGLGLGCSNLKHSYIYAAHTDFIFSIWCEEMGFVGAIFLILIYIAFIWRGFIIAMKAPDTFSSMVVFGIIGHVAIQVLFNIAVVTGLFPNTGITLPFFSYGGTSTLILLAEMGVVLSISRHSYQRR